MPWFMPFLMTQQSSTSNPMDEFTRRFTETLIKDWEEKNKKKNDEKKPGMGAVLKLTAILMAIGPLIAMGVLYIYFKVGVLFATAVMQVIK